MSNKGDGNANKKGCMADFSVVIVENGFPHNLPGFLYDTAVSTFPFWANFSFFDLFKYDLKS